MKTLTRICIFFLAFLIACNKHDFNYPSGKVGRSTIVYFPAISTQGEKLIILNQGGTYTEPGVTATLNGQSVPYTTAGTVDTNTPGVYNLTYTAQNQQGNTASDWRTVVVIGNDVSSNDFSGTYMRYAGDTPFGQTSTWTKTGNGVYQVDNPGGAATGYGYKVIAVNPTGRDVVIPQQLATDPSGNTATVSSTPATMTSTTPLSYVWSFFAPGYGTGARIFKKQ